MHAIYGDFFASEDGSRLVHQLPYFTVAERLELENNHFAEQHEEFRQNFAKQEASLNCLREQLQVLSESLPVFCSAVMSQAVKLTRKISLQSDTMLQDPAQYCVAALFQLVWGMILWRDLMVSARAGSDSSSCNIRKSKGNGAS